MKTKPKWMQVLNLEDTSKPVDVRIYDQIGKDYWSEDGISLKEFSDEWNVIPANRKINLRFNCIGGNVFDALGMYHIIKQRASDVTCINDGVAFSCASWLMCAGGKSISPKTARFMYHNPWAMAAGDSAELRKTADDLESEKQNIVTMYADKCGKSREDISAMMDKTTYMTGAEAKEYGLVDELTDAVVEPKNLALTFDISAFRRVPESLAQPQNIGTPDKKPQPKKTMDKIKILNLLRQRGVTIADDATDEQIETAFNSLNIAEQSKKGDKPAETPVDTILEIKNLAEQLAQLKAANELARKNNIHNRIVVLNAEARIPADTMEDWERRAIQDPTVLDTLAKLPQVIPGGKPFSPAAEVVSEDIKNIKKEMLIPQNREKPEQIREAAVRAAKAHKANRAKILEVVMNEGTNTIPTEFQVAVLLQEALDAFETPILALEAFSKRFIDVPLQGSNKVEVPYYPIETTASTAWNVSNGYVAGDTTWSKKEITVNKRYYQAMSFTSDESSRQPWVDWNKLLNLKANKLAIDMVNDVLSVVTLDNYGAAAFTGLSGSFDSLDIKDLGVIADTAKWPEQGRSCILNAEYYGALLGDSAVSEAMKSGSTDPLRRGVTGDLFGFGMRKYVSLPSNSENLVGLIAYESGILVATAPIIPAPAVLASLSEYRLVLNPGTGVGFTYRNSGNTQKDTEMRTIEVSYGYAVGEAAAIERLVSA